ncbi:mechanosensitive ion channel family protein [Bordetella sp. 15P40C-2]|uniref:mechanosensitive ion channel family protein n=1 Tax=Bordetella sp. 15P40C-2 TaxID=2572246 RepID=UPI0027154ABF|nr:mechanosensitive ion channel family protein [Bordetella sp. 15P40C-2]
MEDHALLVKYLIGAGALATCFLAAGAIMLMKRRKRGWSRSIIVHMVELGVLFCAIAVMRQYTLMAISDYGLKWITPRMVDLAAVAAAAGTFLHSLSMLINRLEKIQINKGRNPTSTRMLARVMKFIAFIVMLLFFGEHFGLSMSGLLAFGGIGGIAIGMASKDILSNVFSGTMLYFDRQFSIGDWIRSPDRNIEGTVVEIGWRLTKIMTFDNRPLYVPNSLFSSISVENPGRMVNRRINTEIGLRYEDAGKIRGIVDDIRQMLAQHPDIDHTQTTLVYFNAFADSSLNIMVYCFTKTTKWAEWLGIQQAIYLSIIDIVQKHGADFAFPSQTVYLEKSA